MNNHLDRQRDMTVIEELRARVRQQAAVAELGQHALAGTDVATLMDEAVELVAATLVVDYCKVLELLPNRSALHLRAGVGWNDGYVRHAMVGAGSDSQAGYTLMSSEPVIVDDLRTETRFSGPPLLLEHGVVSGVSVIIPGSPVPFGVLGAHTTRRRRFSSDDVNFLQSVAHVLAAAIDRTRAEAAVRMSRDQLSLILDGVADGITAQDPTGKLVFANEAAARLTGYPSAQPLLDVPVQEILQQFALRDEAGRPCPPITFPDNVRCTASRMPKP